MTDLTYLSDTYLFESTATVLDVKETEHGLAIILDKTIFYPQGGGQPADHGEISSENGVFHVTDVRLDETGTVLHFGQFANGTLNKGDGVTLKIDKNRRELNAKLHSAGHLIDCAVEKLGIKELKPTKGFHFPDGPYVEYEGTLENAEEIRPELEKTVNELITEDLKTQKEDLSPEEAASQNIWAPPGKSARVVNFEGFQGCGCGGTHVNSAAQIGHITIRKMKSKKGVTKIAYEIS